MTELMPCQMCGGNAHYNEDGNDESKYKFESVECCSCGCSGPITHWDDDTNIEYGEQWIAFEEEQINKYRPIAAERWNDMQKLIARGKLLDESPSSSKSKRL